MHTLSRSRFMLFTTVIVGFSAIAMAVMPRKYYADRIKASKIKAIAKVTEVTVLNTGKHRVEKRITFRLIKSYGTVTPKTVFTGTCYSVGAEPIAGGDIYYYPEKGETVYVTISSSGAAVTSYTRITLRLQQALEQAPDKVILGRGSVKVADDFAPAATASAGNKGVVAEKVTEAILGFEKAFSQHNEELRTKSPLGKHAPHGSNFVERMFVALLLQQGVKKEAYTAEQRIAQHLAVLAHSKVSEERASAVEHLQGMATLSHDLSVAAPYVFKALDDPNMTVRAESVLFFFFLPKVEEKVVTKIISMLKEDKAGKVRLRTIQAMSRFEYEWPQAKKALQWAIDNKVKTDWVKKCRSDEQERRKKKE